MTNADRYLENIYNAIRYHNGCIPMISGRLCDYGEIQCYECDFYNDNDINCWKRIADWGDSEYIEPMPRWYNVPVGTPIIVRTGDDEWQVKHFAKCENELIYALEDKLVALGKEKVTDKWISGYRYAKIYKK